MTAKLLALTKVCSILMNIRDVSWHLSNRVKITEEHLPFEQKKGVRKNKGWHDAP